MSALICLTLLCFLAVLPLPAAAHSFGRIYNLPVPFWLYAYGAAAALLLSFLLVAFFATAQVARSDVRRRDLSQSLLLRALRRLRLLTCMQALSLGSLLLCMATGFFGNRDPYQNFNMTFFWVIFVLGFAYLSALIGDLYAAINPWRVLAGLIVRVWPGYARGRLRYPAAAGSWPTLAFYMAFIWLELFGFIRPFELATMLAAYTAINLVGVWLVGAVVWFEHCEVFGVFLRLTAKMAPLDYQPGQLRLRAPFSGLLQTSAASYGTLLFILFMLSSTAFDGLRATVPWFKLFWLDPFQIITPLVGTDPIRAYVTLRPYYFAYETLSLLLSPFLYLAVYLLFVWLARLFSGSRLPLRELALRFAHSLLPIALVYNITHYYTLLLNQGVKIISLLSDPFGWGWNLFGTAGLWRAPILPAMGTVWHTQVGLILFGHIVSVYLAHMEALRIFPTRRAATLSQLPMLVLMMLFTTAGLWILSQPLQSGR